MPRKAKAPSVLLPSPRVPSPPAPPSPAPAVPSASQRPVSPAIELWLDVIADVIVAAVLEEANHG
jgi:hypothetical protein